MTFSRVFPAYHPKAGQPTYFVEKIWNSFFEEAFGERFFMPFEEDLWPMNRSIPYDIYMEFRDSLVKGRAEKFTPKYHTIRSGKRWEVGDKFSPRVWSGKPYKSKQIIIAPDIEIVKLWDFEVDRCGVISVGGFYDFSDDPESNYETLAKNDGLTEMEMLQWFNKPMTGQVICWNAGINY